MGEMTRNYLAFSQAEQMLDDYIAKRKVLQSRVVQQNPWLAEIVNERANADRDQIIKAMAGR